MKQSTSPLSFHHGNALFGFASTYPTIIEAILENIQNAIDANAKQIWVRIDRKRRTILIQDNGQGVSKKKFEQALTSIAQTIKDTDKLGRFGLGLVSPLGKCRRHTFTSRPERGGGEYLTWTFTGDDIAGQKVIRSIPMMLRPDLQFSQKNGKDWPEVTRTMAH